MEPFVGLFGSTSDNRSGVSLIGSYFGGQQEQGTCQVDRRLQRESLDSLPPELEEGNIEYKFKLVSPSISRFEHLVTQMKWRLREGQGEAIYEIGVEDNGLLTGLNKEELNSSLQTVQRMADKLGAETSIIRERNIGSSNGQRYATEILVRKIPDDQEFVDIRIAVLGNVDAGKSTLLGVLTSGELDNGRGKTRLNLFRHLHEIQSGRTSSISHEILGFDPDGQIVNYNGSCTAEDICSSASKVVTFIDLAGHHKYMKTTIFGLTGYSPDAVMLVVGANTGIAGTTKEHLGLAIALKLPTLVVINKVDLCPKSALDRIITQLTRILKSPGCKKIPMLVEDEDDAATAAGNFSSGQVTPIFKVSCVTGQDFDYLKMFLNLVPPGHTKVEQERLVQESTEFQVDEVFNLTKIGPVVAGTLSHGTMREGDKLSIGPTDSGEFIPVTVTSLHRNRTPCRVIRPGQTATVAITDFDPSILRRGLVILDSTTTKLYCCYKFEAEILLLFHTTAIKKRFQATVHIGNILQTAVVESLNRDSLRTGQRCKVRFRFIKQPEYIKIGASILLREGRTKGIGEITQVYYYNKDHKPNDDVLHIHELANVMMAVK